MSTSPKTCSKCHVPKPIEEFGLNRQTPDGRMYYCKVCAATKQREFRKDNPEASKLAKQRYLEKVRARNDAARTPTPEVEG